MLIDVKTNFENIKEEILNMLCNSSRFDCPLFEKHEKDETIFLKNCKTFDEMVSNMDQELTRYLTFINAINEFIERVKKCKELPSKSTESYIEIECFLKGKKRIIKIIYNKKLFPETYEFVNAIVKLFEANNVNFKKECLELKQFVSKPEANLKTTKDIIYALVSLCDILKIFRSLKHEFFNFLEDMFKSYNKDQEE